MYVMLDTLVHDSGHITTSTDHSGQRDVHTHIVVTKNEDADDEVYAHFRILGFRPNSNVLHRLMRVSEL